NSTVHAAFRILGWQLRFELQPGDEAQQGETQAASAGEQRVRELHHQDSVGRCAYCSWLDDQAGSGLDVSHPCDTVQALDGPPAVVSQPGKES
ncbi:hypothetical protein, partial [Kitasatospora purpeofusca]|uniref:hypothetical protein n=1 Tax=Kitasatospora purpeofusca TaxID=67352 RepID=UPI0036B95DD0